MSLCLLLVSSCRFTGKVGKIVQDDRSDVPYRVKAPGGKQWWYRREAIQKVTGEGGSDDDDESDSDLTSDSGSDSSVSSSDKAKHEVHENVQCDACSQSPITGARWKCEDCDDFDLCGKCYEEFKDSGKHHSKGHSFFRKTGIYFGCCVVTKSHVSAGLKVVRGPGCRLSLCLAVHNSDVLSSRSRMLTCLTQKHSDWKWSDQDGGIGHFGELRSSSVDSDGWIDVKWEDGDTNKYRVEEAADLKYSRNDCVCGGCCIVAKDNLTSGKGLKVVRGPGLPPPPSEQ